MAANSLTLERVLSIWWAFTWRAALAGVAAGTVVGGVGGFIVRAAGSPELGAPVGAVLGWLASIPCSIWAFREALILSWKDFEIVVSSPRARAPDSLSQSAERPDKPNTVASNKDREKIISAAKLELTPSDNSHNIYGVLINFCLIGIFIFVIAFFAAAVIQRNPDNALNDPSITASSSGINSASPPRRTQTKGANMLICEPLPSAYSVTPAQVDSAFRASASNDESGMVRVQDACLLRQSYLLAAQEGDRDTVAAKAIAACKDVIAEYRAIATKVSPGRDFTLESLGAVGSISTGPPPMERSVQHNFEQARIGKCWLQ